MSKKDKSAPPLSIDSQHLRNLLSKTKKNKHAKLYYELYELLDDLNDKRNKFRHADPQAYTATDRLLNALDEEKNKAFSVDKPITDNSIGTFCSTSIILIHKQKAILERHRGIWGVLDAVLTTLASLIVLIQQCMCIKGTPIRHTPFLILIRE